MFHVKHLLFENLWYNNYMKTRFASFYKLSLVVRLGDSCKIVSLLKNALASKHFYLWYNNYSKTRFASFYKLSLVVPLGDSCKIVSLLKNALLEQVFLFVV